MTKSLRGMAAAVLIAGALLTGCANDPTTVGTVEGKTIREADLQEVVDVLVEHSGPQAKRGEAQRYALLYVVADAGMPEVEKAVGKKIDSAQLEKDMETLRKGAQGAERGLLTDARFTESLKTLASLNQLATASPDGRDKVMAALAGLDVTLNPRFGVWPTRPDQAPGAGSLSKFWQPAEK